VILSKGDGHRCDGCVGRIELDHAEPRANFDDGTTLRFHSRCFTRW